MTGATELHLLGIAVIIGLVQILWAAIASTRQRGMSWGLGPRDEPRPLSGVAARLQRALANFLETFPLFAGALLAALMLGHGGDLTRTGAWFYVIGRAIYLPLYAAGTPVVRTIAWAVAVVGIVQEVIAIFA